MKKKPLSRDDPKYKVLERFLGFVSEFCPLSRARLGTMGGSGHEATIWAEHNIPARNSWLVEQNPTKGSALIESFGGARHQNDLGSLETTLNATEANASIDGFHLDLCGILTDSVVVDMKPVLRLVLKSDGRVLGISVADQRLNPVYAEWDKFMSRAYTLFGPSATQIFADLVAEQRRIPVPPPASPRFKPFDPVKGAMREFAVLVNLAGILVKAHVQPNHIERYVYVSRSTGRPFRMRTYLFHFDLTTTLFGASEMAEVWIKSPLYFVTTSGLQVVEKPSQTENNAQTEKKGLHMVRTLKDVPTEMLHRKLRKLAEALDPNAVQYLDSLELKADAFDRMSDYFNQVRELRPAAAAVTVEPPITTPPAPLPPPSARRSRKKNKSAEETSEALAKWLGMPLKDKIPLVISLAELRKADPGRFSTECNRLMAQHFGAKPGEIARSVQQTLARTSGKFRDTYFVPSIQVHCPEQATALIARIRKV